MTAFLKDFHSQSIMRKYPRVLKGGMMLKLQGTIKRRYEVTQANLPLSCPMPGYRLWDAHPRIYLPIEREGYFRCPYCETEYILKDFETLKKV